MNSRETLQGFYRIFHVQGSDFGWIASLFPAGAEGGHHARREADVGC
jgi:hypothetical protein